MYPDSALAAWKLVVLAIVILASLTVWLTAMYLAACEPQGQTEPRGQADQAPETHPSSSQLDETGSGRLAA